MLVASLIMGMVPSVSRDVNADTDVEIVEETVSSLTFSIDTELMRPYFEANVSQEDLESVFIDHVTFEPAAAVGAMSTAFYIPYEHSGNYVTPSQMSFVYYRIDPSLYDAGASLAVTVNGIRATYDGSHAGEQRYDVDLGYNIEYGDGYNPRANVSVTVFNEDGYTFMDVCFSDLFPPASNPDPDPDPDPVPDPDPAPAGSINMFRLYNPNSGEHFYTSSTGERDHLVSLGWNYEGVGWIAPKTSNTPVYRLYNPYGGEHHYTTSLAERNMLINAGWNDEGIGWYSDDARTVPLYRQYNPNAFANNHNYTTSSSENDWLVSLGWRAEGIGWYGVGRGHS